MRINNYEMVIRPNNRSIASEYFHNGSCFIEGRKGSTYVIEIFNHGHVQIKTIVSVDGLCVLDGQPAGTQSPGFVIDPNKSVQIQGWARDHNVANEFVFADARKSYATATNNSSSNIGVIGAMVFQKIEDYWSQHQPGYYCDHTIGHDNIPWNSAGGGSWSTNNASWSNQPMLGSPTIAHASLNTLSALRSDNASVGTGWGDPVKQSLHPVDFQASNPLVPNQILVIYYDSLQGLQKRGIKPITRRGYASNEPQAFPHSGIGCPPPHPSWVKTKV